MMGSLGRFLGLDRAGLAHALRLCLAAWLAFAIASLTHVGNAYWAAMPIWVVSQGAKGLLIERAVFRSLGTLIGAGVGFAILRVTGDITVILVLLGLWVALNATLVHLLPGVHAYGALLAGMTAAVVVLPSALAPDHSLALALARVENTLIGVGVVTLVTGFWTPSSPRAAFYAEIRGLARDAVGFAAAVASGLPAPRANAMERRILHDLGEARGRASLVTAGSIEGYRRLRNVHALTVASIAVMAAARATMAGATAGLSARAEAGSAAARVRALEALAIRLVAEDASFDANPDAPADFAGIDSRLADALDGLVRAEAAFRSEPTRADATPFGGKATYLAVHHDTRLAVEAGLIAGGATVVSGLVAYHSGWGAGPLAALGVCIFSMVLGSLPAPNRVAPIMLKGVAAGVLAAMVYRFAIQPHVTTVPALLISIAPFLLVGGLARASVRLGAPALDANMCFLLASQAVLPPVTDPAVILNGSAALMLAALLVAPGFMALPARGARESVRARAAIRDDLARMVRAAVPPDPERRRARATRQVLRLALHLEKAGAAEAPAGSLLAALDLGEAIARLAGTAARDAEESAAAREALAALRGIDRDPTGVAARLEKLAAGDPASPTLAAAVALRACAPVIFM
jgi:uncharacterized membrane protein YccC